MSLFRHSFVPGGPRPSDTPEQRYHKFLLERDIGTETLADIFSWGFEIKPITGPNITSVDQFYDYLEQSKGYYLGLELRVWEVQNEI